MYINKDLSIDQRRNIVKPTSDIFARYLFTSRKHENLTKSFINAVLTDSGRPKISKVIIKSPFNLAESINAKESVMDVEAVDEEGRLYDVEIQNAVTKSFFLRLSYYQSKLFSGQLKEKGQYEQLKPCISIALLSENIYSDLIKPHHFSALVDREDRNRDFMYPENIAEYHILELPRFEINGNVEYTIDSKGTKRKLHPDLFKWLRFFKDGARSFYMQHYSETDTDIKEAKEAYEKFIDDDRLWLAQLHREMAEHDYATRMYESKKEGYESGFLLGKEKGIQEGMQQTKLETAKKFLKLGIAPEKIAEGTGLTLQEVEALKTDANVRK